MKPDHRNILFVITKSNWGGAQRYVYDLATALPKDEFDVGVAFGQPGQLAEELTKAGIKTHLVASMQRDVSLGDDIKSFFELIKIFRAEKPYIVHLNSSKAGGIGSLAARLSGVPRIIFTAHGWPFMEKRPALWRLVAWLGSWATAILSHSVIAVSENDLSIGKRLPFCGSKMQLVYNGIVLPPLGSGDIIRNAFPAGAHITGTIGELNRNKNQIALIEQARSDPHMYVAIVGDGEERANLEEKIREYGLENRVKLFGFLTASEVLRGFDTFALPSLKEGLPYVLIEARMAGLHIVANRVGGVGEILDAKDMSDFSLDQMVRKTTALYLS
ncbi:MAG: glycosyltransferase [Candidatus Paceibacterota bacterium]|jgi:glycosyltransferase involved in cell wall biosynthesis